MSNNNEDPKPVRKTWMMLKKAPPIANKNWFITKDNKKFMTADGQEFLVKEAI